MVAHLFKFFFAACESVKFNAVSTLSQNPATGKGEKYGVKTEKSESMCRGPYILLNIYEKFGERKQTLI